MGYHAAVSMRLVDEVNDAAHLTDTAELDAMEVVEEVSTEDAAD